LNWNLIRGAIENEQSGDCYLEGEHQMKNIIKGKIVSANELSRLMTTDDSEGITSSDIEKMFSSEDLKEYNMLCENFVKLIGNKNNKEQWDMLLDPATGLNLTSILNSIEELRSKYNLPGTFHRMWRAKPLSADKFEYDEVSW
jgi:hypothetical protein